MFNKKSYSLNTIDHFSLSDFITNRNTDQYRVKISQETISYNLQAYNSMESITKIENGVGFSQPSFGLFTQSTATELGYLSNSMNLQTKSLSLVGNMAYYRSENASSNSSASYSKHYCSKHVYVFQRSMSSHSLNKNSYEDGAVRRIHSSCDIMGRVDSSVSMSKEYSMIIEGMTKVSRYSPQEKRERIERYRSKRNLRNFKKKIQYDCRKILADTRRRSKGRFMRNDETSTMAMEEERISNDNHVLNDQYSSTCHQHKMAGENELGEEISWINLLDYFPCQY